MKQYTADQKVLSFYKNVHLSAHNYLHFVLGAFNLVQNSSKRATKVFDKMADNHCFIGRREVGKHRLQTSASGLIQNLRKFLRKLFCCVFQPAKSASHAVCWSKGRCEKDPVLNPRSFISRSSKAVVLNLLYFRSR